MPQEKSHAWHSQEPRSAEKESRWAGKDPASGLGEPDAGEKESGLVLGESRAGLFCRLSTIGVRFTYCGEQMNLTPISIDPDLHP